MYDVIVIGGGPAGLTAARFAAQAGCKTLLLERLPRRGMLDHPCGGVLWSVPGLITCQFEREGIHLTEVDFLVPADLIIGGCAAKEFLSPGGKGFGFYLERQWPIVDKGEMLRLLAGRAEAAGAELRFGAYVSGLLKVNGVVRGVVVNEDESPARVVISAEGISGRFCQEAGLGVNDEAFHAYLACYYLAGLRLAPEQQGDFSFLNDQHVGLPGAFGAFMSQGAERAEVFVATFTHRHRREHERPLTDYLEAFMQNNPRVSELCRGGVVEGRVGCRLTVRPTPRTAVADGFIGVGDAIVAGGELLSTAAMAGGKLAAETASAAIAGGDASRRGLAPYDRWLKHPYMRELDSQYRMYRAISGFSEQEIERVFAALDGLNLMSVYLGSPLARGWYFLKFALRRLPAFIREWGLIRQLFWRSAEAAMVEMSGEACNACGLCVKLCPQIVFAVQNKEVVVAHEERCFTCFTCEDECPQGSIRVVKEKNCVHPGSVSLAPPCPPPPDRGRPGRWSDPRR